MHADISCRVKGTLKQMKDCHGRCVRLDNYGKRIVCEHLSRASIDFQFYNDNEYRDDEDMDDYA